MKIFETDQRVNFVDKNNVFVGYSLAQDCCEHADWFISKQKECTMPRVRELMNVDNYIFDTNFFEIEEKDDYDVLRFVRFRLIAEDTELFLHLYNHHNGYYSHGFEAKIGGLEWQQGRI
jgi:hypothetical protein